MSETSNMSKPTLYKLLTYYVLPIALIAIFFIQPRVSSAAARQVLSILFLSIVLLALAMAAVLSARRWMREAGYSASGYRLISVVLLGLLGAGALFFFVFYSQERDIRVYDFSAYWVRLIEARQTAADSLTGLLSSTISSLSDDYTIVAVLPLIPLSYLFGTGYFGYVLSVFAVYCIPACFFLALLAMRIIHGKGGARPGAGTLALCTVFGAMLPGFIWPVLNGYLDIAGVLFMALLLNVGLHWDGGRISWKHVLALSALSLALLFTRRWYVFYIIGFYISHAVFLLLPAPGRQRAGARQIGAFALNIALIAALCSAVILVLNRTVFSTFLTVNYASAYSVAKTLPWWQNLWQIVQSWGLLWLFAALAGMAILLLNAGTRAICIRLLTAAVVAFALFSTVQNLEMHHFYLVTPTLFLFVCVFCHATVRFMQNNKAPVFLITLAAVHAANFVLAFLPAANGLYSAAIPFTTVAQRYPRVYPHYDIVREITDDLRQLTAGTSQLVYVVGSSELLSAELLKRAGLPEQTDSAPFVMYSHIVDLRDGFPSQLFMADYVVLEDPYEESFDTVQQVGYQVVDMLTSDPQVSPYYQLERSYPDAGHTILIYKKIRPTDTALVDDLMDRLEALYPSDPSVYQPDYQIALYEYDRSFAVEYDYWGKSFAFRHSGSRPVEMGWRDTAGFTRLQFAVQTQTTAMELTIENQDGVLQSVQLEGDVWESLDLDITGSDYIHVVVTPLEVAESDAYEFLVSFYDGLLQ